MSRAVAADPTPLRRDENGVLRMGETRVSFDSIVYRHKQGDTPAEIHEGFPDVPLADIFAAISYYLRHQEEVEGYLAECEAEAERIRREVEVRPETQALRAKLRALRDRPS
jgi:uncharacterized protein (DUF433 family)